MTAYFFYNHLIFVCVTVLYERLGVSRHYGVERHWVPGSPRNALGASDVQMNFLMSAERTAHRVEARHDESAVLPVKFSSDERNISVSTHALCGAAVCSDYL